MATIVAALIAGAISFVNLTLTKEQKTSEFRQAWIDALREDLATFFATIRAFSRAHQELQLFGKDNKDDAPLAITGEMVSNLRYQVAETKYRIQLRLNPKEKEHIELFRLMNVAMDTQQRVIERKAETNETLLAVEAAASYAPDVLKKEWDRVKKGEFPFRLVRNWIAPAIIIISIGLMTMFWFGMLNT
ncbi:hypothetical protein [Herminiimonas sp. CN]|uniref:hypothetical protein n=1 Tax=Herminiimonas sp. CN TaxID=1349818 RepID=UPI001EE648E7|nr:hypothetical protein [Herminiimonas sp. CN]